MQNYVLHRYMTDWTDCQIDCYIRIYEGASGNIIVITIEEQLYMDIELLAVKIKP